MLDCRRSISVYLVFLLACCITVTSAFAETPARDGFTAVPQIWPYPEIMQIAPDRRFLTIASDHEVAIVALTSGTILRRFETGGRRITGIEISADSTTIIVGFEGGLRRAWSAETGLREPSVPEGMPLTGRDPESGLSAYKVGLSRLADGTRIDISSGTKAISPLHLDVEGASCGYVLEPPVFDGRYLISRLSPGEGDGYFTPAVAWELKNGSFHEIWHAPCDEAGHDSGAALSDGARFLDLSRSAVGPMTLWDLKTDRGVASFEDTEGFAAVSAGARVVVAAAYADSALTTPLFKILQDGRTWSFPRQMRDIQDLFLSPDGHWLAASDGKNIFVWSIDDGRLLQKVENQTIRGIANGGRLVPAPDDDETFRGETLSRRSADGLWGVIDGHDIFDLKRNRRIAHLEEGYVESFDDAGHAIVRVHGAWRLLDLATSRALWTLDVTPDFGGYVMTFPDGCVEVASGFERFVKLVRGFEVRPFDAAAARVFAKPACTGHPAAIAASEAAFAADQRRLAAMARDEEDEKIRASNAAIAEAARKAAEAEAQRRADEAARRIREQIDGLWDHPETRLAAGPQRAALIDEWPAAIAPGRLSIYRGAIAWALTKAGDTTVAVGTIALPQARCHVTVKIFLAKDRDGESHGILDIVVRRDDRIGLHIQAMSVPRGRAESEVASRALNGVVTSDAPDAFHVHLPARAAIDQLLAADWIDLPLVESKLKGKLTFEKGTEGQRMIAEALGAASPH